MLQQIIEFLVGLFKSKVTSSQITSAIDAVIGAVNKTVTKNAKFFPAVYETQRNNKIDPSVTCNPTSVSMAVQSLCLPEYGFKGTIPRGYEDYMLADLKANLASYAGQAARWTNLKYLAGLPFEQLYGDFNFWAWYLFIKHGISTKLLTMTAQELFDAVMSGQITTPSPMSTAKALTSFGHIIVCRGAYKDQTGQYLSVNDPYGTYPYGSRTNGEGVSYDIKLWKPTDKLIVFTLVNWPGKAQ